MTTVHALVLAAGGARRFGSPKALADYRGRALVRHVVESVGAALQDRSDATGVTVVLGPDPEPVRVALRGCGARTLVNEEWAHGISGSIRAGVRSLPQHTAAVLIALGDQALVDSDDYRRLLDTAKDFPDRPIASRYADTVGVPAVFPADYFERLCNLHGDRGAGSLLIADTRAVSIEMPRAAYDIDTPEQLAAAIRAG